MAFDYERARQRARDKDREQQQQARNNEQYQEAIRNTVASASQRITGSTTGGTHRRSRDAREALQNVQQARSARQQQEAARGQSINGLLKNTLPGGSLVTDFHREKSIQTAGDRVKDLVQLGTQQDKGRSLAKQTGQVLQEAGLYNPQTRAIADTSRMSEPQRQSLYQAVQKAATERAKTTGQRIQDQLKSYEQNRDEAAKRMNALAGGRTQLEQREYAQAKADYDKWDSLINQGASERYTSIGQALTQAIESSDTLSELYGSAVDADTKIDQLSQTIERLRSGSVQQGDGNREQIQRVQQQLERVQQERQALIDRLDKLGIPYDRVRQYVQWDERKTAAEQERQGAYEMGQEHPIASTAGQIVGGFAKGVDFLTAQLGSIGHNDPMNPDSYVPQTAADYPISNYTGGLQEGATDKVREDYGSVAAFLYNTGTSVGQSAALVAALGPAASYLMGAGAASDQALNIVERGGSNTQAFWGGLAAGAAEVLAEKVSIEKLLEPKTVSNFRGVLRETLKQAGTEASEEAVTEIANILSDAAIMGENSDTALRVQQYMAHGMTKEEAQWRAFRDNIGQVALSAAGGAISGGVMGGAVNLANYAGLRSGPMNQYQANADTDTSQQGQAETGTAANQAAEKVDITRFDLDTPQRAAAEANNYILEQAGVELTDQGADRVLQSAENRQAFERLTGETLEGDIQQQRQTVKEAMAALPERLQEQRSLKNIIRRLTGGENVDISELKNAPEVQEAYRHPVSEDTSRIQTPERQALRSQIVQELSNRGSAVIDGDGKVTYNGSVDHGHQIDIVIGLPAAGKSSALADPLSQQNHAIVIDSDEAKLRLPEYDGGYGAGAVHQESKRINAQVLENAYAEGANIVLPIVGGSYDSVVKYINQARKNGYTVNLYLNELPMNKAVGRAMHRFLDTGRFIRPEVLYGYGDTPTQVYQQIVQEGLVDDYAWYSNDVPKGHRPRLVQASDGGRYLAGGVAGDYRPGAGLYGGRYETVGGELQGTQGGAGQTAGRVEEEAGRSVYPSLLTEDSTFQQAQARDTFERSAWENMLGSLQQQAREQGGTLTAPESRAQAEQVIRQTPFSEDAGQQAQNERSMAAVANDLIAPPGGGDTGGRGRTAISEGNTPRQTRESSYYTNTLQNSEEFGGIFQDVYAEITSTDPASMRYEVVQELQSMAEAAERVRFDPEGETEALLHRDPSEWSGTDIDTAMGLIANYQANGQADVAAQLAKQVRKAGTRAGQLVQAFAKYTRTGTGESIKGLDMLENSQISDAKKQSAGRALLESGKQIDAAMEQSRAGNDAEAKNMLLQSIRKMADQRNTTNRKGNLSRNAEWALSKLTVDDLHDIAMAQLRALPQDLTTRRSAAEVISAYTRNSQLSKLSTTNRNLGGNALADLVDSLATNISVPLDRLLSRRTGKRTVGADASWFSSAKRQGAQYALAKSYAEVYLDVDTDGAQNRYGSASSRTFKMTGNVVERLLSRWEKNLGYLLNTSDETFKGGTRAQVADATQKFVESGLLTETEQQQLADQTALERTFQQDSRLSQGAVKAKNAMNAAFGIEGRAYVTDSNGKRVRLDSNGLNIDGYVEQTAQRLGIPESTVRQALQQRSTERFGLGNMLMNYPKVPTNLADLAIDYSPVGAIRALVNTINVAKNAQSVSALQQRQASVRVGRSVTGSAMLLGLTALCRAGLLRVAEAINDEDKDRQRSQQASGLSGTQLNLSATERALEGGNATWQEGDQLVDASWLQPFDSLMTVAGMLAQDENLDAADVGKYAAAGVLQSVMNTPVMDGLQSFFQNIQWGDSEFDGENLLQAAGSAALDTVANVVPNFVYGIAQGTDQTQRDMGTSGSVIGESWDRIKARIPGLRQTLPAKTDEMGNPLRGQDNMALQFFNENINPGKIATYRRSDVQQELDRLYEVTGDPAVYAPSEGPSSVQVDGEKVKLTTQQRDAIKNERGRIYDELASAFQNSEFYGVLSDTDKSAVLQDLLSTAQKAAIQNTVEGYEPSSGEALLEQYRKNGAKAVQYAMNNKLDSTLTKAISEAKDGGEDGIQKMDAFYQTYEALGADAKRDLLDQVGGQLEKYVEARRAGIDSEDYAKAKAAYTKFQNDESMRAPQRATEFAAWLDRETNLSSDQKNVLQDAMAYYSFVRAEPTGYERMKELDVSSESATAIMRTLYQRGQETDAQKWDSLNAADVPEADKWKAAQALFGYSDTSKNAKLQAAQDAGLTVSTMSRYYNAREYAKEELGKTPSTKAEQQAVLDGMQLDVEEKRALWLITDLSHKPWTSPYGMSNESYELYNWLQQNKG